MKKLLGYICFRVPAYSNNVVSESLRNSLRILTAYFGVTLAAFGIHACNLNPSPTYPPSIGSDLEIQLTSRKQTSSACNICSLHTSLSRPVWTSAPPIRRSGLQLSEHAHSNQTCANESGGVDDRRRWRRTSVQTVYNDGNKNVAEYALQKENKVDPFKWLDVLGCGTVDASSPRRRRRVSWVW